MFLIPPPLCVGKKIIKKGGNVCTCVCVFSLPPLRAKKEKKRGKRVFDFFLIVFQTAGGGVCICFFKLAFDLDIDSAHGQPAWCRARPSRIYIRRPRRHQVGPWSRGHELVGGVLRSCPKPGEQLVCLSRRIENLFVTCFPSVLKYFKEQGRRMNVYCSSYCSIQRSKYSESNTWVDYEPIDVRRELGTTGGVVPIVPVARYSACGIAWHR